MKKLLWLKKHQLIFVLALLLFAPLSQNAQTPTSSPDASKLVTEVLVKQETLDLANKALDELEIQDKLIASQDAEIKAVSDRLETEKQKSSLIAELAESRKRQADLLLTATTSAKEAIAAKDEVIANKDREIELLKKRKTPILTIIKAVAIGIGVGLILK